MRLKDIKELFQKELNGLYDKEEIDNFFYLLIQSNLEISRFQLALNPNILYSDKQLKPILKTLGRLKLQAPIQYIIGKTEFFGLPFKVNSHVLIPRPETEELVDWIIKENNEKPFVSILDIGTGSGCIAISLAKQLPNAKVFALDVSKEALEVAKQNAKINNVDVSFIEANILDWNFDELQFDVVVSNPPYVRELEKEHMKTNVLDFEPHLALFVDNDDPLKFYRAITQYAVNNLNKNGLLFFEINEYLGNQMIELLQEHHFNGIELKQDMFGKDRMIKAIK